MYDVQCMSNSTTSYNCNLRFASRDDVIVSDDFLSSTGSAEGPDVRDDALVTYDYDVTKFE